MISKIKKTKFCRILTPRFGSFLFQVYDGLISCIIVLKEFLSVFNKQKINFVTFHGNSCKEEKNASSITGVLQIRKNLCFEKKGNLNLHSNLLTTLHKTFAFHDYLSQFCS